MVGAQVQTGKSDIYVLDFCSEVLKRFGIVDSDYERYPLNGRTTVKYGIDLDGHITEGRTGEQAYSDAAGPGQETAPKHTG